MVAHAVSVWLRPADRFESHAEPLTALEHQCSVGEPLFSPSVN